MSIVTSDYKAEKTLKKLIESIDVDSEIKIIHDDDELNLGATGYRNLGIESTKGEYILFIDNDAYFEKGCIQKLLEVIKNFDIVYPKVLYENGVLMQPKDASQLEYPSITVCFMIRRKSLDKLDEWFDDNYKISGEDQDFFTRCKLFGLKAKYVPDAVAYHIVKKVSYKYKEKRHYMNVRNFIYGYIKFSGIKVRFTDTLTRHWNSKAKALEYLLIKFFVNGLLNYSKEERLWEGDRSKISLLLHHSKTTNKTPLYLMYFFFKAVFWNIKNRSLALEKKSRLETKFSYIE